MELQGRGGPVHSIITDAEIRVRGAAIVARSAPALPQYASVEEAWETDSIATPAGQTTMETSSAQSQATTASETAEIAAEVEASHSSSSEEEEQLMETPVWASFPTVEQLMQMTAPRSLDRSPARSVRALVGQTRVMLTQLSPNTVRQYLPPPTPLGSQDDLSTVGLCRLCRLYRQAVS
jgi:hypothetical protein